MRVVFYIWSLGMGGAERHTLDLAARLASRGVQAQIVVHAGVADPMLRSAYDVEVDELRLGRFAKVTDWRVASRFIDHLAPDVVVGVNMAATIAMRCSASGRGEGPRPVSIFHSTELVTLASRLQSQVYRVACRDLTLVFCSELQRRHRKDLDGGGRRVEVITNGVDLDRFVPPSARARADARRRIGAAPDHPVFGLVAAFRPEKNHLGLVEAAALLRAEGRDATLVFVGDGPTRWQVEAAVHRHGLCDHVRFVGKQADVRPYLHGFDVGVICSTGVETFSLAALEAAACGLPLVMSRTGGAAEIVREGVTGFLCPPSDTRALADSLRRACDSEWLRGRGSIVRAHAEALFGVGRMVDQYGALFARLVSARGGPRRD